MVEELADQVFSRRDVIIPSHAQVDFKTQFSLYLQEYTIPPRSTPKTSESSSYYYEREERDLPAITSGTRTYNYESATSTPGKHCDYQQQYQLLTGLLQRQKPLLIRRLLMKKAAFITNLAYIPHFCFFTNTCFFLFIIISGLVHNLEFRPNS